MAIEDPDHARRLARSICVDIQRYHAETLREGRPHLLAEPIWEGHQLYTSRVAPALEGLYAEAVMELLRIDLATLPGAGAAKAPMPHPPTGREAEPSSSLPLVAAALALLLVAAVAAFALLAR